MMLDFSRCRLPPFAHQRQDVQWLVERPYAFIASEMRTGKTKIVIDAAQFLFTSGVIDRVIVVAPAPVRDVWFDEQLGEISKHVWESLPIKVSEYHARIRSWSRGSGDQLRWIVTNFEFLTSKTRLEELLRYCGPKTLLVGDESSFLKNYAAQRTKAFAALRKRCGRVVLLNGTPIFHSPLDLFSQGNILSPAVLECKSVIHYRARYAVMKPGYGAGGRTFQQVVSWRNLDDLQRRFAPITVRRLQRECLDLPPKLDPITLTAELKESWPAYKKMRDDLVIWLGQNVAMAGTAAIKVMRLSQITSGFVGGVEAANIGPFDDAEDEAPVPEVQEVGREKLDVLLWFLGERLAADPKFKCVVWCRFRPELLRMVDEVQRRLPQFRTAVVHGGQKNADRTHALSLLKPEMSPDAPVFVGGTFGTGSFGLDMCAAHTSVTMSSDYSPGRHAQAADRVYGPGQTQPIAYYDVMAIGPGGRKTIDHAIIAARRAGEEIANWTASRWARALEEE